MTPVGHAAVGYVVGRAGRATAMWAFVAGALAPDLDFALFWAPQFNAWHRVVTHNLTFVALVAGIVAVASRRRGAAAGWGALVGGLTHLFVDACMDANPTNGIGVALAWPWSDAMFSPFNVLSPNNRAGWTDLGAAAAGVARGMTWELPFVLLAGWWWWRDRPRSERGTPPSRDA